MTLSDFLSRQNHDESNPHEVIPILFNMQTVLQTRYVMKSDLWFMLLVRNKDSS